MSAELARHVGHRAHLLDPRRLRCDDCTQTVWLPDTAGATSTSSRSPIPGPGEPRCPTHPTEHASSCRTCAADAKAATDLDTGGRHTPVLEPTADVPARAAEARALLPARTTTARSASTKLQARPYDDPERMAQARAELAAREPVPLPEQQPAGDPT